MRLRACPLVLVHALRPRVRAAPVRRERVWAVPARPGPVQAEAQPALLALAVPVVVWLAAPVAQAQALLARALPAAGPLATAAQVWPVARLAIGRAWPVLPAAHAVAGQEPARPSDAT